MVKFSRGRKQPASARVLSNNNGSTNRPEQNEGEKLHLDISPLNDRGHESDNKLSSGSNDDKKNKRKQPSTLEKTARYLRWQANDIIAQAEDRLVQREEDELDEIDIALLEADREEARILRERADKAALLDCSIPEFDEDGNVKGDPRQGFCDIAARILCCLLFSFFFVCCRVRMWWDRLRLLTYMFTGQTIREGMVAQAATMSLVSAQMVVFARSVDAMTRCACLFTVFSHFTALYGDEIDEKIQAGKFMKLQTVVEQPVREGDPPTITEKATFDQKVMYVLANLDDMNAWADNEAADAIMRAFAGIGVLTLVGDKFTEKGFTGLVDGMVTAVREQKNAVTGLMFSIRYFFVNALSLLYGEEYTNGYKSGLQALAKERDELVSIALMHDANGTAPQRDQLLAYLSRCDDLLRKYKDRQALSSSNMLRMSITSSMLKVTEVMKRMKSVAAAGKTRPAPFAIDLVGTPGGSKSDLAEYLDTYNHFYMGMEAYRKTAVMNPGAKHHDLCFTWTTGLILDENLQALNAKNSQTNPVLDCIQFVNNTPYQYRKADLSGKQGEFCMLLSIVTTGNEVNVDLSNHVADPGAFWRRFPRIKVIPKPQYCKPGTTVLRGDLPRIRGFNPYCTYHFLDMVPRDNRETGVTEYVPVYRTPNAVDHRTAQDMYDAMLDAHIEKEIAAVEASELMSKQACPGCGRLPHCCKCFFANGMEGFIPRNIEMSVSRTLVAHFKQANVMNSRCQVYSPVFGVDGASVNIPAFDPNSPEPKVGRRTFGTTDDMRFQGVIIHNMRDVMNAIGFARRHTNRSDMNAMITSEGRVEVRNTARQIEPEMTAIAKTIAAKGFMHNELVRLKYCSTGRRKPIRLPFVRFDDPENPTDDELMENRKVIKKYQNRTITQALDDVGLYNPPVFEFWRNRVPDFTLEPRAVREGDRPLEIDGDDNEKYGVNQPDKPDPLVSDALVPPHEDWPEWVRPVLRYRKGKKFLFKDLSRESGVNYFMWLQREMVEGRITTPVVITEEANRVGIGFRLYDNYPSAVDPLAMAMHYGVDVTKWEILKGVIYASLYNTWSQSFDLYCDATWIVVGAGHWRYQDRGETVREANPSPSVSATDLFWTKVDSTIGSVFPVLTETQVNTSALAMSTVVLMSTIAFAPLMGTLAMTAGTGMLTKGLLDRVNVEKIPSPEKVAGSTSSLLVAGGLTAVTFSILAYIFPLIPDKVIREGARGVSNVWRKPEDIRVNLSEKVKTSLKDPVIRKFKNNGFSLLTRTKNGEDLNKCNGFSVDHNFIIVPNEAFFKEKTSWLGKKTYQLHDEVEFEMYFVNSANAIQRVKKVVKYSETVATNSEHRTVRCTTFGARANMLPYFPDSVPRGETKLDLYSFRNGVFTKAATGMGTPSLTDPFGSGKMNAWTIVSSQVTSRYGDCGGIWFADYGKGAYIGGLHTGRLVTTAAQTAYAEIITRNDVQQAIDMIRELFPGTPPVFESAPPIDERLGVVTGEQKDIHPKHTINYMPMESSAVITGQYGDGKKERNRMEESPLRTVRDALSSSELTKVPASFDRRHLGDAIRQAANAVPRCDQRALSQAFLSYVDTWARSDPSRRKIRHGLFTKEEVERRLNASTSTGPPMNVAKWKVLLWSENEQRYTIPDDLWSRALELIGRLRNRAHSGSWHTTAYKEELRSIGKDTRVIYPAALLGLIIRLLYFGPLIDEINSHGLSMGLATGLDPQSTDAQDIYTAISSLGGWVADRVIATDFKGYDLSLLNEIKGVAGTAFVHIDSLLFDSTEEERLIKESIMQEIACPEVEVRGVIVQLPDMIASGDLFTNAMDGVCGQLILRYVYYLNRPAFPITRFSEEVAAVSMGDDMIGEVSPRSSFNCIEFKEGCSKIGIVVTGPDKAAVRKFYSYKEADFLKRRFVNHDGVRRVVMALDPESILNSFTHLIPSPRASVSVQMIGTARSAMELAWPNGRIFYDNLQRELIERLTVLEEPIPPEITETYDARMIRLRDPEGRYAKRVFDKDPWFYETRLDAVGSFWAKVRGDIPWREADFHQEEGVEPPAITDVGEQGVMLEQLGEDQDSDPNAWFTRPILVDERAIVPEADMDVEIDPLSLWMSRPEVKERMQHQGMMRFEMEISVEAYAPRQSSGAFLISYIPLYHLQDPVFQHVDPVKDSQAPSGVLRLGDDEPVTIKAPFVWFADAMNILDGSSSLYGMLRVQTLARMRETVVTGHRSRMLISVRMSRFSMGQSTIQRQALSDYLTGASNVSRAISGLPIGKWATVASIAAQIGDGIASVARKHGFSRPNVSEAPTIAVERSLGSMASGDAPDMCVSLAHTMRNTTSIDPRIVGSNGSDEMSIQDIAARWSYLDSFEFKTSNVNGDLLYQIGVTPVLAKKRNIGWAVPACTAAALPFSSSSFTMEYLVVPVATQFHNGQIQVNYDPVSSTHTATRNIVQNAAIQVSESRAGVVITVEWNNPLPLLPHNIYHDNFGQSVTFGPHMNGVLSFVSINPLMSMRPQDLIKILVFVRCPELFVMKTDEPVIADILNGDPPASEGYTGGSPPTTVPPTDPGGSEPPLDPEEDDGNDGGNIFNPVACGEEYEFTGFYREQFVPVFAITQFDAVPEESPFANELVSFKRMRYLRVPVTVRPGVPVWCVLKVVNVGATPVSIRVGVEGCDSILFTTIPEVIALRADAMVNYSGKPVQLISVVIQADAGDLIIDGYWTEWHPQVQLRIWTTRPLDATMPYISGDPRTLPMIGFNQRTSMRGWMDQAEKYFDFGVPVFPPAIWGYGGIKVWSKTDGKTVNLANSGPLPDKSPGPDAVRPFLVPFDATSPNYQGEVEITTDGVDSVIASIVVWSESGARRRLLSRGTISYPLLTTHCMVRNCLFTETDPEGFMRLKTLIESISGRGSPYLRGPVREGVNFGGQTLSRSHLELLYAGEDLQSFRLLLKKSYPLIIDSPIDAFSSPFFPLVGSNHLDNHSLFRYVTMMFIGVRGGIRVKVISPEGTITGFVDDGDPRFLSRNLHLNRGSLAIDLPFYHTKNFLHARGADPYDDEAHNFVIINPRGIGSIFYAASESFNLSFFLGLPLLQPSGEFSTS